MPQPEKSGYMLPRIFSFFLKRMRRGKPFHLPADITQSSKILFIDSGDITDLLFTVPLVNYFHRYHPRIQTVMLVRDTDAEIVKSIMNVNRIITYEKKQLNIFRTDYISLVRKLHHQSMDSVILLCRRFSLERFLLAFMSGAKVRIGFSHQFANPFINCEIRLSGNGYIGDRMARVLESVGLKIADDLLDVSLPERETSHARQLIHFRKPEKDYLTVVIDPSRGKMRHQVIPEILAYLANNLASRRKVKFLVLTNPWDEKLTRNMTGDLRGEVIDLVPEKADEAVALLSQCDLFLSGNTNLFHFAAKLKVPSIGVFTKYDGRQWLPDSATNVRIFKGIRGEKLSLKSFFSMVDEVLSSTDSSSP